MDYPLEETERTLNKGQARDRRGPSACISRDSH